jgi:hypothetical protein
MLHEVRDEAVAAAPPLSTCKVRGEAVAISTARTFFFPGMGSS